MNIEIYLASIAESFAKIADALGSHLAIVKPIGEFAGFDFASIGATVLKADEDGPTVLEKGGKVYKRRAPDNKYGAAIWFSRCVGKSEDGTANKYETLISFEQINDDVDPIGQKARQALHSAKNRPSQKPSKPVPAPKPSALKLEEQGREPATEWDDNAAAAMEAAHSEIEHELRKSFLGFDHTVTEWEEYYDAHELANLSIPDKRILLEKWLAIPLQAPQTALSANQQAILEQIREIEGFGVPADGEGGWRDRMATMAGSDKTVEQLDPAAAAKVRTSFTNWLKDLRAGVQLNSLKTKKVA